MAYTSPARDEQKKQRPTRKSATFASNDRTDQIASSVKFVPKKSGPLRNGT